MHMWTQPLEKQLRAWKKEVRVRKQYLDAQEAGSAKLEFAQREYNKAVEVLRGLEALSNV